jgi:O-acetyl-ADP-ribose deacetylase (regulator of RNase III)
MGSGIAFAIRRKWPVVYDRYCDFVQQMSSSDKFEPNPAGMLGLVQSIEISSGLHVCNCFTQENCGSDGSVYADVAAVSECLESVFSFAEYSNLPLFLPKIGCGLGGLNWETDVRPILDNLHIEHPCVSVTVVTWP